MVSVQRFGGGFGAFGAVAGVFLSGSCSQGPASHSHQKVGFRVTVGGEFQNSKKGERSTSQLKPTVSLDIGTVFQKSPQVM